MTLTACGDATTTGGDGGTDAAQDAKKPNDAGASDANPFPTDAQDEPDAFDPPDVVDNDVITIKPPMPIH